MPPGQEITSMIANAVGANKASPEALTDLVNRFEYTRNAVGNALKKPDLTHDDVLQIAADAVKAKVIPASEVGEILGTVTSDPTKLRADMDHRYMVAMHALVHLHGEQAKRSATAQPEGQP